MRDSIHQFNRICILFAACFMFSFVSNAAILSVTSPGDSGPGTLRDCISRAGSGDNIIFAKTAENIINLKSPLTITKGITITGPMTINGQNKDPKMYCRVFDVNIDNSNDRLVMNELTIENGHASNSTSCSSPGENGGGIYIKNPNSIVFLEQCSIKNCAAGDGCNGHGSTFSGSAGGNGGGIYNLGTLTVSSTVISSSNSAGNGGYATGSGGEYGHVVGTGGSGGNGGAIYNAEGATLELDNSIVQDNYSGKGGHSCHFDSSDWSYYGSGGSGGNGGGICSERDATLTLDKTEIGGNYTGQNGKGSNQYTTRTNATGFGGGIYSYYSNLTIKNHSTIDFNHTAQPVIPIHSFGSHRHLSVPGNGGGIWAAFNADTLCAIEGNSNITNNYTGSGYYLGNGGVGGGVYIYLDGENTAKNIHINDNTFMHNWTGSAAGNGYDGGNGGGIYINSNTKQNSNIDFTGNKIENNYTGTGVGKGVGGNGGGIYLSDAALLGNKPLLNNVFNNNAIGKGGQGPDIYPIPEPTPEKL